MIINYTLEADVDDYVKKYLEKIGLKKLVDFNEKSSMSQYLKEALKGSAKTINKTNFGIPDFNIEKYNIPVIIENKLGTSNHISASSNNNIKLDDNSVKKYAVNGAVYYAQNMIKSKKYDEVIAIGISANNENDVKTSVYYVFSANIEPKLIENYKSLDFLQNADSFNSFIKQATVTEEERHKILIKTRSEILKHAKKLNKLMNNYNISVDQRVSYVSGMLLAMQDVYDSKKNLLDIGLLPEDLKGIETEQKRDSKVIVKHLEEYLEQKNIDREKKGIMLSSFESSISLDPARDKPVSPDINVAGLLKDKASVTKQIFVYLYEYVYKAIDDTNGALDIIAEMYSTFLKYALSDGAQLGKVLTPPYITSLMTKILDVNKDSKVMDLATGSAAFLVAAMDAMINDSNYSLGKNTEISKQKIKNIKQKQLLGIEIDAKMYTLAAANMILRGDGSSSIKKADSFEESIQTFKDFNADILLLNPPFSYKDCGLPFLELGLDNMKKGGKAAIIIQDAIGAGKASDTVLRILGKHRMLASIKMPPDLFIPNAIVQTSIYIFEAKIKHNFDLDIVKFIDFRKDGYKRTERGINEIDNPALRYNDLYIIYKQGLNAKKNSNFHANLWDLEDVYIEDTISRNGNDLNYEQHASKIRNVTNLNHIKNINKRLLTTLEEKINSIKMDNIPEEPNLKPFKVCDVFNIDKVPSYNKAQLIAAEDGNCYDYITRTIDNYGISQFTGYIGQKGLNEGNNFSLGLLQMEFFYREKPWYAGQFIRKITCKYEIDKFAGIYLETVLNTLSPVLASKLVRDIDEVFLNLEIMLPEKNNKPDIDYMSKFVINHQKTILNSIIR